MPLLIEDDILQSAGMDERLARIEISCRLFEAGKLALWPAARLAQLERVAFEEQLLSRGIPIYRPTPADLADDLAQLDQLANRQ